MASLKKLNWNYGVLDDVVSKGSSNISLNKIKDDEGEFPVFGAKGYMQSVSFFQQENEYLAIIKDGAGIGRISEHPAKSSVLATMQYLLPKDGFELRFIKYCLESIDFSEYRTGSTIPHIYFKDYKSAPVPLPPIPEQKRIVALLDTVFADLEQTRAKTEQNLKNARELFDSYLQQVFSQQGEGWVDMPLGNICNFKHGFAFKSEFFVDKSNLVLLTPGSFFEDGGYRDREEKTKYYNGEFPEEYLLSKGDLLVAMTEQAIGLLGSSALVPENDTFLHNQRLGLVELTPEYENKVSLTFLFHLFNTKYFRAKVQETASGLKVRHTSPKKMQVISVRLLTDLAAQEAIAQKLFEAKEHVIELELIYQQKLNSIDELKKSILQKAFSGELTATAD
jgi:type I restriction enzyme S subunit